MPANDNAGRVGLPKQLDALRLGTQLDVAQHGGPKPHAAADEHVGQRAALAGAVRQMYLKPDRPEEAIRFEVFDQWQFPWLT